MLRWLVGQKQRRTERGAGIGARDADAELEFLRSKADFDAEEMASVSRRVPIAGPSALESRSTSDPARDPGTTQPAIRFSETLDSRSLPGTPAAPVISESGPGQLTLAVLVDGRQAVVTVHDGALIGRADVDQGTMPEIDLSLDDAVSRSHARIYRRGGQYFVQELRSTNGTCLNGEWVHPSSDEPLKTGDMILLGECSELQVLGISFGTELTTEDRMIGNLLNEAMGVPPSPIRHDLEVNRSQPAAACQDVLDLALSRGIEAGLLEADGEWERSPALPDWRLRDFDGLELPGLVERYR